MLILHALRLLARTIVDFPTVISGNWLSILLPVGLFLCRKGYELHRDGWGAVTEHWKRDTWLMVGAYGLIFFWSIARTIYQDHTDLVSRSHGLSVELIKMGTDDSKELQSTKDTLNGTIADLRVQCGVKEGMNLTLQNQNRDQQSTINNCQTEALKLLTPSEQKTTPLLMEGFNPSTVDQKIKFLVLTNKIITPVKMVIFCDQPVQPGQVSILGSGLLSGGVIAITPKSLDVEISTPAWSPISPMIVSYSYTGTRPVSCTFTERG